MGEVKTQEEENICRENFKNNKTGFMGRKWVIDPPSAKTDFHNEATPSSLLAELTRYLSVTKN